MLFLLGYAATNDVRNVPLAVFDQDRTRGVARRCWMLTAPPIISASITTSGRRQEMRTLIDSGAGPGRDDHPAGLRRSAPAGRGGAVAFVIDGSDPTVATTALSAAILIGQAKSSRIMVERLPRQPGASLAAVRPPIDVRTQVWYNPDLVSAVLHDPRR